eukprot:9304752-Pyramimonas_sp.AAC.1
MTSSTAGCVSVICWPVGRNATTDCIMVNIFGVVEQSFESKHWACLALAALKICELADQSIGMKKKRFQMKSAILSRETCPTYYLRPSNGPSSQGTRYPEPLHSQVTD